MLRDQARLHLCFHLISSVARANRPAKKIVDKRVARTAAVHAIANGHVPILFDGDAKSERRLAILTSNTQNERLKCMRGASSRLNPRFRPFKTPIETPTIEKWFVLQFM